MTTARSTQVSLEATPYYHCIARCVRQAFLCGTDTHSGKDFNHRKPWVVDRIAFLASIFTIDVCAYVIMSNHLHVVLRVVSELAQSLDDDEIVARHSALFNGSKAKLRGLSESQRKALIETWRSRLMSVSWFMRCLNEWVARRANLEDGCRGRFWEGRFRCKPLLDETGLLTCMAYVDLNPIRAGLTDSLEGAEFTSIEERLRAASAAQTAGAVATTAPRHLAPMADDKHGSRETRLPIDLVAYVELLQWTARATGIEGQARLSGTPPSLLVRHSLSPDGWDHTMYGHELATCSALGRIEALEAEAARRGLAWVRGKRLSRRLAS